MALTESKMMDLGTLAPDFNLLNTLQTNTFTSFSDIRGKQGTVVMFLCNHCPYVIHINEQIVKVALDYLPLGIGFVSISSNDAEKYPQDGPDKMSIVGKVLKYPFPYLYDETQDIAKLYDAACTPDIFLFDQNDLLVYRGRIDSSRPGTATPSTGLDLRMAIEHLLRGEAPLSVQYPSAGCNIKWK